MIPKWMANIHVLFNKMYSLLDYVQHRPCDAFDLADNQRDSKPMPQSLSWE